MRATAERLPETIVRMAIEWQMRLRANPDNVELFSQCQAWRLGDARHELAWQRMQQVSGHFHGNHLPDATRTVALLRKAEVDLSRRRTLKLLGVGLAAGSASLLLANAPQGWRSDFATQVGERRQLLVDGGVQLQLNTDSAVDVHGREIFLHSGEVLVDGADWRVRCKYGVCDASQARAVLREREGYSELHVERGEVRVSAAAGSQRVQAGHGLALYPGQLAALHSGALDPFAWARGLLIVNDIRLAEFLSEASRYRRGWLHCDPQLADLRLSGVFRLDEPATLLGNITHLLPVRIEQRTRWWVRVVAQA
ncbi:DUF4880 domain-containing protein [Pseudomonas asiatica]|uniref:DUF4880 domain-containing protein n=1 Tax=Pseudomonas asiatica TaxID=2219225 RepID=UPI002DBA92B3|nr:DUF4880 domain-containing protein [Pseudomonas asiatica]MEB6591875.1 DUF4880 domain-containing protein [Pseudomonas asiatica]